MDGNTIENRTLTYLLLSKEWGDLFRNISKTTSFELSILSSDGGLLFNTGENHFCGIIKAANREGLRCPDSCIEAAIMSQYANIPVTYMCQSKIINFSFPIEKFDEKVIIRGQGSFTGYGDFLEFLKLQRANNLPGISVKKPLSFCGEDYAKAVSLYVFNTVNHMLNSMEEKHKLEEKFLRMTSLFDSHTFATLSRNPELLHRYILDTIEFVFGKTSAVLMELDDKCFTYNTVHTTGKHKDEFAGFQLDAESHFVRDMHSKRSFILAKGVESPAAEGLLAGIGSFLLMPVFSGDLIVKIIGIFDGSFSREDLKIMNAFRDYLQLNIENQHLRLSANTGRKADERISCFSDFTGSLTSVLNKEMLFQTIVEKSLQFLDAEQGSLMLLDRDTSELVVEAKKGMDDIVQEKMRLRKEETIAGRVLDNEESLLVEDIERDPRFNRENRPRYKTKSFISILIKIEDRVTGVLNISDKVKGDAFTEEDLRLLQSFVNSAAIAIERSLLYKQTEELKQLSITDPLTGIYNRRYLNTRLSEEITRYNRYRHPFSFMMLDMDKFKEYNDSFGHISGDRLIKALATIMEKSLRNVDIAARFGGDEFVAIFPQTSKVDAVHITHRLKEKIDKALVEETPEMPLTVSMGLTTYPDDASSVGELLEKTDQALYLAKRGGGDKVVYL
ncbi:MAG: sensor domain-containing diguanylate cyclase [Nitrospiraceae bacterium]|nr:MAG: sensor domain-containing diguanylate cyclase [Nitrospiraceae bacterium]